MRLYKEYKMPFEDKNYEIRIYYNDRIINVVAFLNNYPANGFRHQIHLPKEWNPADFLDKKPVQELVEITKTDITTQRWQRFIS